MMMPEWDDKLAVGNFELYLLFIRVKGVIA
jgi:hypothetical protein